MPSEKFDPDRIIHDFIKSGRPLNILVSEDELITQKYLESMFRKIGLSCDCALDGRETLASILRNRYDIVLLDMQMPQMNGEEVLAELKRKGMLEDTYVIVLTAYSMTGDEEKYLSLGCRSYIAKPIDWNGLKFKIAEAIVYIRENNN
jgi:CheY-like chemotaxis protein